jgi:antirestriction protein ArdC
MKEASTSDISFVRFCIAELGIQTSPNIRLGDDHRKAQEHRAMGYYSPADNLIWVLRGSRVPADWYRTLAHELVHWRQRELGQGLDGADGSEIENEANSKAAVLLREWGRRDAGIYVLPNEEQPADPQVEPATP